LAGLYWVLSCESHSMRVRPAFKWSRALAMVSVGVSACLGPGCEVVEVVEGSDEDEVTWDGGHQGEKSCFIYSADYVGQPTVRPVASAGTQTSTTKTTCCPPFNAVKAVLARAMKFSYKVFPGRPRQSRARTLARLLLSSAQRVSMRAGLGIPVGRQAAAQYTVYYHGNRWLALPFIYVSPEYLAIPQLPRFLHFPP
jgi:hypothetical protein